MGMTVKQSLLFYQNIKKEVSCVVELDQFKTVLNTYRHPLQEVRDSL